MNGNRVLFLLLIVVLCIGTSSGVELKKFPVIKGSAEVPQVSIPVGATSGSVTIPTSDAKSLLPQSPSRLKVDGFMEQSAADTSGGLSLSFKVENLSTESLELTNPLLSMSFTLKDKLTGQEVQPLSPAQLAFLDNSKSIIENAQESGHLMLFVDSELATKEHDIVRIRPGESRNFEVQILSALLLKDGEVIPKSMKDMTGCYTVSAAISVSGPTVTDEGIHMFNGEICLGD